MSALSAALAAMDKATKGPWVADLRGGCCAVYQESKEDQTPGCHEYDARNLFYSNKGAVYLEEGYWEMDEETQQNFVVAAAAPDALAWIKEALPWLEERRADAQNSIEAFYLEVDGWEQNPGYVAVMNMNKDIVARLDALIARAKPEDVGR